MRATSRRRTMVEHNQTTSASMKKALGGMIMMVHWCHHVRAGSARPNSVLNLYFTDHRDGNQHQAVAKATETVEKTAKAHSGGKRLAAAHQNAVVMIRPT